VQICTVAASSMASPEELRQIRELARRCQECGEHGDMSGLGEADQSFHEAILAPGHNDVLVILLETLRPRVHVVRGPRLLACREREGMIYHKRVLEDQGQK
jgi:DNA-binding GntR family transcriptional regulator